MNDWFVLAIFEDKSADFYYVEAENELDATNKFKQYLLKRGFQDSYIHQIIVTDSEDMETIH